MTERSGRRPGLTASALAPVIGVAHLPGWRPLSEVLTNIGPFITAEQRARDASSRSVGASLFFLEYARRLCWPVLTAHLRDRLWLDASIRNVFVRPDPAGRALVGFGTGPVEHTMGTEDVVGALVGDHLETVVAAVRADVRDLDPSILWGNAAAAIANGFLVLSWASADRSRYLETATRSIAGNPLIADLVSLSSVEIDGDQWFVSRRRRCCLAMRSNASDGQQAEYCGSCPILGERQRASRFRTAAVRYRAAEERTFSSRQTGRGQAP